MELLILGGTVFLGRHLVQSAREAGHAVTLFNRGQTNPELFGDLETLIGDRKDDLAALADRTWDAVIDTSGYTPSVVGRSAKILSGNVDHYTFISSISVYPDTSQRGLDEKAETAKLKDGMGEEEVSGETYGPLKALSEEKLQSTFGGQSLIIRPGLIVGPHDPTDRFTYWPRRLARGGPVLAPGEPDRPVQLIDVRDLTGWIIELIEAGEEGIFNATGPDQTLTMETMLKDCKGVSENDAELIWVDEDFLLETGVQPFTELPLWLPNSQNGLLEVDISKAVENGLTFRPLAKTAADTLAWDQEQGGPIGRGPALGPARELALLEAWLARQQAD